MEHELRVLQEPGPTGLRHVGERENARRQLGVREQVEIERVPVSETDSTIGDDTAFTEQEIDVPVMREEAVVGKEARSTGEVRLNKTVSTETETVGGDVRREDVQVDRDVDTETGTGYTTDETTNTRF